MAKNEMSNDEIVRNVDRLLRMGREVNEERARKEAHQNSETKTVRLVEEKRKSA